MEFVAQKGFSYMGIPYFHMSVFEENTPCSVEPGWKLVDLPDPNALGLLLPIYVAETDDQAQDKYEEHFWYFAASC